MHEAPFADFFPSANPALPGDVIQFDGSSSHDPERGNLSYAWSLGDGTTSAEATVEHAYEEPGAYVVALTVTSDASNLTDEASLTLTVVDPETLATPLVVEDAEGDVAAKEGDILAFSVFENNGVFLLQVELAELPQTYSMASLVMVDFTINDAPYEVYGSLGSLAVYDFSTSGDLPGADVSLDESSNVLTVRVPSANLGHQLPYRLFVETRAGDPNALHGQVALDRAPDESEAFYEG